MSRPTMERWHVIQPNLPPGMLRTIMLRRAKEVAKAEMQASGIKRAFIEPREVFLRAQELMQERREQFEAEALAICLRIMSKNVRSSNRSTKPRTENNG
jgi:hypothetical protein